eukprot:TRINITY_DN6581_c0_g1_i1.p1 TRINITY_DN6581_c0_g1~~TRINITY_DN6581_c0_g1_i1.p1  ORF type:complete len:136 (-),score=36.71 TRINITY_DN6581_c0_g1_i1:180-587(-)
MDEKQDSTSTTPVRGILKKPGERKEEKNHELKLEADDKPVPEEGRKKLQRKDTAHRKLPKGTPINQPDQPQENTSTSTEPVKPKTSAENPEYSSAREKENPSHERTLRRSQTTRESSSSRDNTTNTTSKSPCLIM